MVSKQFVKGITWEEQFPDITWYISAWRYNMV